MSEPISVFERALGPDLDRLPPVIRAAHTGLPSLLQGRVEIEAGLNALGIEPAASQANFCWFDLPETADEAEVVKGLAERGVLVRAGGALGREGALRVTVGTQAENERFLETLAALL